MTQHVNECAFLSVAVDTDPTRPGPFAARYSFPTAIDSTNTLGRLFDFDVVPNGLFLDEHGIIQFLHVGGFEVQRPEIVQQVEALLHADFAHGELPRHVTQEPLEIELLRAELAHQPNDASLHVALGEALLRAGLVAEAQPSFRRAVALAPNDWAAAFALGTALRAGDDQAGALEWWRRALALDPRNFTVRKQIWREEHPERFYPTIDTAWQREQLVLEGYLP